MPSFRPIISRYSHVLGFQLRWKKHTGKSLGARTSLVLLCCPFTASLDIKRKQLFSLPAASLVSRVQKTILQPWQGSTHVFLGVLLWQKKMVLYTDFAPVDVWECTGSALPVEEEQAGGGWDASRPFSSAVTRGLEHQSTIVPFPLKQMFINGYICMFKYLFSWPSPEKNKVAELSQHFSPSTHETRINTVYSQGWSKSTG